MRGEKYGVPDAGSASIWGGLGGYFHEHRGGNPGHMDAYTRVRNSGS